MIVKYKLNQDGTTPMPPHPFVLDNGHFRTVDGWFIGYFSGTSDDAVKFGLTPLSDEDALAHVKSVMPDGVILKEAATDKSITIKSSIISGKVFTVADKERTLEK